MSYQQIPVRQQAVKAVPTAAISQAVAANGTAATTTTDVYNQIAGDKELHIQLSVAGASDVTDVVLFFGAWNTDTAIKNGVTFSADGFPSFAAFKSYFEKISTNIAGLRMETSDVSNYQSTLKFTEKDPSGEDRNVTRLLSKYRVPVGNGYSETLEIGPEDMTFNLWSALQVTLSKLKAGSTLDIYFMVKGWNKTQKLSALNAAII